MVGSQESLITLLKTWNHYDLAKLLQNEKVFYVYCTCVSLTLHQKGSIVKFMSEKMMEFNLPKYDPPIQINKHMAKVLLCTIPLPSKGITNIPNIN